MPTASATTRSPYLRSLIPARVDRLPWSKFHTRLVIALGVAWVLDGLEITRKSQAAVGHRQAPRSDLPGRRRRRWHRPL